MGRERGLAMGERGENPLCATISIGLSDNLRISEGINLYKARFFCKNRLISTLFFIDHKLYK